MRPPRLTALLFAITLTQSAFAAEAATQQYGDKGTFDLSLGMSAASTTHSSYDKSFTLSLTPYANHFLFNNWFARYQMPAYYSFSEWHRTFHIIGISPGLAVGYSFKFNDAWRLNFSAGYATIFTGTCIQT